MLIARVFVSDGEGHACRAVVGVASLNEMPPLCVRHRCCCCCRYRSVALVLNASSPAAPYMSTFLDPVATPASLPFACQLDVSVGIVPSTAADLSTGRVVTFGDAAFPNGTFVCADAFSYASGVVACRQAGFDTGRALAGDATITYLNGTATLSLVGQRCSGSGAAQCVVVSWH